MCFCIGPPSSSTDRERLSGWDRRASETPHASSPRGRQRPPVINTGGGVTVETEDGTRRTKTTDYCDALWTACSESVLGLPVWKRARKHKRRATRLRCSLAAASCQDANYQLRHPAVFLKVRNARLDKQCESYERCWNKTFACGAKKGTT